MQTYKFILLIVGLIALALAVGIGVCEKAGNAVHAREAVMASGIGLAAAVAGVLPLHLGSDRSPVMLFQSAWIGSVLHLTIFLGLGATVIFVIKPPTAFVIWLLAMYWLTLLPLCAAMIGVMRSPAMNPASEAAKGG